VALRKAARGDSSFNLTYLLAPGSSPPHPSLLPVGLGLIPALQVVPRAGSKGGGSWH
jgi:hypothetical protein